MEKENMVATINGIPVYDAIISDEETGMIRISLVDDPAVMSNFQAFSNKRPMTYSVVDEDKHLIRGCVMRADFPIYRRDEKVGEYYIIYKADQIRKMAEKYLAEGRCNNVNLMHEEGSDVDCVKMVQYFIKGDGVAIEGYDDIADGSLFAEFHVVSEELWKEIKDGTFKGFSLEGVFDLEPDTDEDEVADIVKALDGAFSKIFKHMGKRSRFMAELAKLLQKFGNVTTDKGVIAWDGDDDLKEGDVVYIVDAEGNQAKAEDGDYKTEDNKVIVVVDGKVAEIKDDDAQVAPENTEDFAEVATDNGTLLCEGEIEVGKEVFVMDGEERVVAPDGEYKTEDKTIVVAEGVVTEIKDNEPTTQEPAEQTMSRFERVRQAYEESYQEKERQIAEAVYSTLAEGEYGYLVECGEDYAVLVVYTEEGGEKYFRYAISWNEDGTATASNPEEVKPAFVDVNEPNPSSEEVDSLHEEVKNLKEENARLQAEVEKMGKMSFGKSAHKEVVETSNKFQATGDKGLDRLATRMSAK